MAIGIAATGCKGRRFANPKDLHYMARTGDVSGVRRTLWRGADLNRKNKGALTLSEVIGMLSRFWKERVDFERIRRARRVLARSDGEWTNRVVSSTYRSDGPCPAVFLSGDMSRACRK
jgi:hypothetical protein